MCLTGSGKKTGQRANSCHTGYSKNQDISIKQRIYYDNTVDPEIAFIKSLYKKYYEMTKEKLKSKGIIVHDLSMNGIDINGIPVDPVFSYGSIDMLPLRKDERAVYSIECRNHVFGLPSNGIGIRYIYIDEKNIDLEWMNHVEKMFDTSYTFVLSICTDGQELYFLCDDGRIMSTDDNWISIEVFDPIQERLRYAAGFTSEEISAEKEKRLAETPEGRFGIFAVNGYWDYFYDTNKKVFFRVSTFGSYSEGYDVSYYTVSKRDVMKRLSASFHNHLYYLAKGCSIGEIPDIALVNSLPEEFRDGYIPPVEVGSGYIYS